MSWSGLLSMENKESIDKVSNISPPQTFTPNALFPLESYVWMLGGSFAFTWMGIWTFLLAQEANEGEMAGDWRVIAFFRSFVAFFGAWLICMVRRTKLIVFRPPMIWVRSLAGSLSLICTFFALTRLTTPEVLTLTNTYPLWIGLFAGWVLGEWPGWGTLFAAVIGVGGVALVQQPHGDSNPMAVLAALGASGCTATAMMGLNRLKGLDNWAIVTHFSAVALFSCLMALIPDPDWLIRLGTTVTTKQCVLLFGVGMSALLGQYCLTQAFTKGIAARVAIVGLSQIPLGLLIDTILFDRVWNYATVVGMLLVILPTAWVMSQRKSTS